MAQSAQAEAKALAELVKVANGRWRLATRYLLCMLVFVRLNPDRFTDPRYAGLENRLYRAELLGPDEVRIELPDGSWLAGDPAHFHVRSGALPSDRR